LYLKLLISSFNHCFIAPLLVFFTNKASILKFHKAVCILIRLVKTPKRGGVTLLTFRWKLTPTKAKKNDISFR